MSSSEAAAAIDAAILGSLSVICAYAGLPTKPVLLSGSAALRATPKGPNAYTSRSLIAFVSAAWVMPPAPDPAAASGDACVAAGRAAAEPDDGPRLPAVGARPPAAHDVTASADAKASAAVPYLI